MKKINQNIVLTLIVLGIAALSYISYITGHSVAENEMDSLLMVMTLDSNMVTAGLYEELPNNVRKTMSFYMQDTPTKVNDIKMFAQVKYVSIGGKEIKVEPGQIWNIIKKDRIFQRQFKDNDEKSNTLVVPNSPYAFNENK